MAWFAGCMLLLCAANNPAANVADSVAAGRMALADGLFDIASGRFRSLLEDAGLSDDRRGEVVDLLLQSYQGAEEWSLIERVLASTQAEALQPGYGRAYWESVWQFGTGNPEAVLRVLTPLLEAQGEGTFERRAWRLAGRVMEQLGDPERAADWFRKYDQATAADPNIRAENLLDLGRVLRTAGHFEAATNAFSRLIREAPEKTLQERARFELGRTLGGGGQVHAVPGVLHPIIANESLPAELRALAGLEIAAALLATDDHTRAAGVLEKSLGLAAGTDTRNAVKLMLGDVYVRSGRPADGIPLWQSFVAETPSDERAPSIQLRIGRLLLEAGEWDAAESAFLRFLEAFESVGFGLAAAYEGRGLALVGLERYSEASDTFLKAREVAPDTDLRERALRHAAEALFAAGRHRAAKELFARFIEQFPEHEALDHIRVRVADCMAECDMVEQAVALLGDIADSAREAVAGQAIVRRAALQAWLFRWEDAHASYDRLLAGWSGTDAEPAGRYGRGLARYHLGRSDAIDDFESVRGHFPESIYAEKAMYMQALSLERFDRYEESARLSQAFLDAFPHSEYAPLIRFWMAETDYNRGAYEDAEQRFLGFAALHPTHTQVDESLFRAGLAAFRQQAYLRANAHFGQLFSTVPESPRIPDARFAQADALVQLGRFAESILILDEIIKRYPGHSIVPYVWLRKGDCHFAMGGDDNERYEESIRSYRAVTQGEEIRHGTRLQAEYKIGRSLQKLNRSQDALDQYYMRVMVPFLDALSRDGRISEAASLWFMRAALSAVEVLEARQDWRQLVRVLDRVAQTRVPIAEEARRRSRAIRAEYWWLFY